MEANNLDQPYISVYDRPERPRGRPKIYTDEELKERRKPIKSITKTTEITIYYKKVFCTS